MTLPEEFHALARKVNNWGRWGPDDELGTLNLITPEVVRRGALCVRTGERFSLALPLGPRGPQTGSVPGRVNPLRTMTHVNTAITPDFAMSDDVVFMALQAATHWDALSHVSYDGRIYNGHGAASITPQGASRCAIDAVRTIAGRGVLLDVARAAGVERFEGAVTPDDLDACGVSVEPGDIVLIRTGQMRVLHEGNRRAYQAPAPGPGLAAVEWFHAHDVAAVATDTMTFEVFPSEREDAFLPVHLLDLVEMGMLQGQNFDLEALAYSCAADGECAFFLEASPEPFVGGVGAPVNPVDIR